ncbi:MAG TPA: ABC transporter substrate-binding protein [Chloroflexota bacterium]|nr:ABC transporter substrate-binding protein [Chloroflexota bacterium]
MKPVSRRSFLRVSGLGAAAAILSACGGAASPTAAPTAAPTKPAAAATTAPAATSAPAGGAATPTTGAAAAATKPAAAATGGAATPAAGATSAAGTTPAAGATAGAAAATKPAAAGTTTAAAPAGAGNPNTIKIVSSLPRTGSSKGQTDTIVNSIKMALEEANNKAGSFTLTYDDLDDATAAKGAWDAGKEAENAQKAVADPDVMVYIGTFNSGAAKVSIPILNQASLVMISPANTYPGLTKPGKGEANEPKVYQPSGKPNYTRVVPADDIQGSAAAGWAKDLGAKSVYVLDDTELYGHGIAVVFTDTAKKIGLTVANSGGVSEGIDTKAQDYRALAQKIKATNPDMVYFGGITQNNAGKLWKDLRNVLGDKPMLMGPDGIAEEAFIKDAGDAAEGTYVTFGGLPPDKLSGAGADWYKRYKAKYNGEPEVYAVYGYEAAKVAIDAIGRAGKKDRAAIRDAVFATKNFQGALGTWSFDENGDTTLTTMSGMQVKGGKLQFVKELKAAT